MGMPVPRGAHLIRLWAFLQKEIILLISKARGPLAPPGPACRVPSSILGRKSLAKGLPTLQLLPSCGAAGAGAGGRWQATGWGPGALCARALPHSPEPADSVPALDTALPAQFPQEHRLRYRLRWCSLS